MLNWIQIRALSGPLVKVPDLMCILPPRCISTCVAGSAVFLEDKIPVISIREIHKPKEKFSGQNVHITVLVCQLINEHHGPKTASPETTPNHHAVSAKLAYRLDFISVVPLSLLADHPCSTIIAFDCEARLVKPNDASPLFRTPIDSFLGPKKPHLLMAFSQPWLVCRKVRSKALGT
ncbi:hypothetical protein MAM1_0038c02776 [Mucor ambiguus]|uniref:Uncharacterized protein n=1 Tax=Mucor ambiguus TaxID=91626 RepID=A0A0C9MN18_9FUNG|nr:hypothetical protein MAM1_0038c02776 [Mucor ambiguus]